MTYVCGHCGTQVSQRVCTGCGAVKIHGMTAGERKGSMGIGAFAGFVLANVAASKFNMSVTLETMVVTAAIGAGISFAVGAYLYRDTVRFFRREREI